MATPGRQAQLAHDLKPDKYLEVDIAEACVRVKDWLMPARPSADERAHVVVRAGVVRPSREETARGNTSGYGAPGIKTSECSMMISCKNTKWSRGSLSNSCRPVPMCYAEILPVSTAMGPAIGGA